MTLKLGAYTACLHDRPLAQALEVLKDNGLTSVEVNTGGFIPSPHCHVDLLLSSEQARADYLGEFSSRGMELTGLNCNGNPLNPLPGVGPKHADDMRRSIELAGALGINNIVCMSGTPGRTPTRGTRPGWSTRGTGSTWTSWTTSGTSPRSSGARSTRWPGPTTRGWPSRCTRTTWCSPRSPSRSSSTWSARPTSVRRWTRRTSCGRAWTSSPPSSGSARWCSTPPPRTPRSPPASTSAACSTPPSSECPPTPRARSPPGTASVTKWPDNPGWKFVAVGIGHDVEYWTEFLRALAEIDPDMAVNIEHEDADYGRLEGLALAAENPPRRRGEAKNPGGQKPGAAGRTECLARLCVSGR